MLSKLLTSKKFIQTIHSNYWQEPKNNMKHVQLFKLENSNLLADTGGFGLSKWSYLLMGRVIKNE